MDGNVHGTHVAGIIASNGKIKGVAPNASILAYRVMNDGGTGTTDDIIQGIERAIQDGADVLNLSLGQDLNVPDQPVTLTLERAKLGVTAVVSNGNDDQNLGLLMLPVTQVVSFLLEHLRFLSRFQHSK